MPIRELTDYIATSEKKLLHNSPLTDLQGCVLGIDGMQWLRALSAQINDPLCAVIGGDLPPSALSAIDHALHNLLEVAKVRPVFIFGGLSPPKRDRNNLSHFEATSKKRAAAWESYYHSPSPSTPQQFQQDSERLTTTLPFVSALMEHLRRRGIECIRAPYLSWAQLAYLVNILSPAPLLGAAWGGLELAFYGVSKFITDIDFAKTPLSFDWVDSRELLTSLSLSQDQFLDVSLLSGFDPFCSTFSFLPKPILKSAVRMVKESGSGRNVIQKMIKETPQGEVANLYNYLDTFLRARALVKHHPIFNPFTCMCAPFVLEGCPGDLSEIIGPRLPHELYYYLSIGALSPQVVHNLISGALVETPPMADSTEYQELLGELLPIRTKSLGLLSTALNADFQGVRVSALSWSNNVKTVAVDMKHAEEVPPPDLRPATEHELDTELQVIRGKVTSISEIDMSFLFQLAANRGGASQQPLVQMASDNPDSVWGPPPFPPISTPKAALAYTLLQGLTAVDHISQQSGRLTTVGAILQQALHAKGKETRQFEDQALVALELVRGGYLSGKPVHPLPGNDFDATTSPLVRLISRVFSLVPMQLAAGEAWKGPIDYDLSAFSCLVGAFIRTLRNLHEMIFVSLLLRNRIALANPAESVEVASLLPFQSSSHSTSLGVFIKSFLQSPSSSLKFSGAVNLQSDLKQGLLFWNLVLDLVRALEKLDLIKKDLLVEFTDADLLLRHRVVPLL